MKSKLQIIQEKRALYTHERTKRHQYLKNIGQYHGTSPSFRTHGTRQRINILDMFKPRTQPASLNVKPSFFSRLAMWFKSFFRM